MVLRAREAGLSAGRLALANRDCHAKNNNIFKY